MMSENEVVQLNLEDLIPNRFQPREIFDERALKELSDSIKEHGVIQPIIVRNIGEKYEIIAGERRYKASAMAGKTTIPAIIKNLDDKESSKVALLENLQRKDLTAIEEARTYQKILEIDELTQEELAKTMGKSQSAIANKLRLLSLSEEVQDALLKEQISERHARSLLNVKDRIQQIEYLNKILSEKMTVKDLENELKRVFGNAEEPTPVQSVEESKEDMNYPETDLDKLLEKIQKEIDEEEKNEGINNNNIISPGTSTVEEPKKGLDFLLGNHIPEKIPQQLDIETLNPNENKDTPVLDSLVGLTSEQPNQEEQSELFKPFPFEIKSGVSPIESLDSIEPLEEEIKSTPTLIGAINQVRDKVKMLEREGFSINVEEMDFEDTYQIVIKVNKNK